MNTKFSIRTGLLVCTALASVSLMAGTAHAQAAENDSTGLEEIVVTAQKREQSVQDVPIAVTALAGDALESNRVTNVTDLSGLAPGFTVRTSAGGSALPSFVMRGAVSYGVVPGSDKQVSIYLDGVYFSNPRGSIFDLPDVQRIEVLRGPQGSLFGRNATAGAVSISTRDPSGEAGFTGTLTVGNYQEFRGRASVDLPQMGPFSGYVSYVHDERRGDIKNLAAGQSWDRRQALSPEVAKVAVSPEYLGSKNVESIFAAVKFEPTDNFSMVYKFDKTISDGTPEGTSLAGYLKLGPVGGFMTALIASQPYTIPDASDGLRPDAVSNGWNIGTTLRVEGHSLTTKLDLGDVTIKNIFAYRKSYIFTASAIDGIAGIKITPQAAPLFGLPAVLVGSPFLFIATAPEGRSNQWSNEIQLNYDSKMLTLTAGAIWFKSTDYTATTGYLNTPQFVPVFNGVLPFGTRIGQTNNFARSLAAYVQAEFHVNEQLDIIGGVRITDDHKNGDFIFGTLAAPKHKPFDYKQTKPNYLIGVNYKPNDDLLLYAKFSTAFVTGGSVAGVDFGAETAVSWEAGLKAEFLDKRLRTNLAVYTATYKNYQTAQGSTNFRFLFDPEVAPSIGTFVLPQGTVKATGVEFEFTAAPARGATFGGSLAYTKTTFSDIDPRIIAGNGGAYVPTLRPDWTGSLWGQYETQPLFGDAYLSMRLDGIWQSEVNLQANPGADFSIFPGLKKVKPYWLLNGRVSLRDINIAGAKFELAAWGRNLSDVREKTFALPILNLLGSANFIPARTYGLDFTVKF